MAQISRSYKYELPILIRIFCRNYNKQRHTYTHYEVLRVSPNATQKEIRNAYIKLTKEMHPDSGKGNHADFVKLNEAYNVLSKSNSRHSYDINLRYNSYQDRSAQQYSSLISF
ncbi:dnaJ homolog subfamily C member 4-like isoform X2 [Ceratina calcarata]|uniref:DnaJ homolog subfamily C member 4-like isoform X2 n=1 Tax=Ceratina calcarata TaxID=156304 RepID=A0AAJ7S4K5_9HYME|nr:dnaJ homolog subfamily C member 4-like isoform X2 [Ceratina calcarata]